MQHDPARPVTYRWLRSIAHLRFALAVLADMLSMYVADTPEKLSLTPRDSKMLEELVKFLSPLLLRENLQGLSMYLAKHLARRHGMKTLKCLYNQGHRFVLPLALHQQVRSPRFFFQAHLYTSTHKDLKFVATTVFHICSVTFGSIIYFLPCFMHQHTDFES